jgi:hypothetical protein
MNYLQFLPIILAILALIVAGIALFFALSLQKLRKIFFAGKDANQLEDFIINQNKKINTLTERADYIEEAVYELAEAQKLTVQRIGVMRYNSLADSGGNLSFSIALLDAKGNGVVVSSMHGRENNRVYAKPIVGGKSEFSLTEEEVQAINSSTLFKEQLISKNNK